MGGVDRERERERGERMDRKQKVMPSQARHRPGQKRWVVPDI